jgi:hypothetical protein
MLTSLIFIHILKFDMWQYEKKLKNFIIIIQNIDLHRPL